MIVKYVSSEGVEINLNRNPYKMLVSDIIDYEWEVVSQANRISGFRRTIKKKKLNIDVHRTQDGSARKHISSLTDIFENDLQKKKTGRIYIDDNYMDCYIYASEKNKWETGNIIQCEYSLATDCPFWITEKTFQFARYKSDGTREFLNFPFNFPYNFTGVKKGVGVLANDNYAPAHFTMLIYGNNYASIENPSVEIGGYTYTVHTTVNDMESLRIDSKNRTIKKNLANGTEVDEFNSRNFHNSVFEKIKPGTQTVKWSGEYDIILTIYQERSEPRWNPE